MFSGFSRRYGYLRYLRGPESVEYCQVRIKGWICLPVSAPLPFNLLFRQKAAVSLLRHRIARCGSSGILTVSSIGFALRLILRHRLTPGRLTSPGKPWSYGEGASHPLYRYLYLHLLFRTLQHGSRRTFYAERNAPLPIQFEFHVFGVQLIPDYYPCLIPRLVSCYALFK